MAYLEAVCFGRGFAGGGVDEVVDELGVAAQLAQSIDGRQRRRLPLGAGRAQHALGRVGRQKVVVQIDLQRRWPAAHHLHHLSPHNTTFTFIIMTPYGS